MSDNQFNSIFKYIVNYSGLVMELVSDDVQLLEINFLKNKKFKEYNGISDPIKKTASFLDDYFSGKRSKIEIVYNTGSSEKEINVNSKRLSLDMRGYTEKEIYIYRELIKTGPGERISYGELARKSGVPRGARFAGNCMAGNRFPVIIPCHRVIKGNGSIGNYSGGVDIKEFLLKHEAGDSFSKK